MIELLKAANLITSRSEDYGRAIDTEICQALIRELSMVEGFKDAVTELFIVQGIRPCKALRPMVEVMFTLSMMKSPNGMSAKRIQTREELDNTLEVGHG